MSKLKIQTKKVIDDSDWDALVRETYGKPYCFQQQYGCQERGNFNIHINKEEVEDDNPENIPFEINGEQMGVAFKTWLKTSEKDINKEHPESYKGQNSIFWDRNFYPDIQVVANDLCRKGLIEEGEYIINIDW